MWKEFCWVQLLVAPPCLLKCLQIISIIIMTSNLFPAPLKCCGTFEDILFESFSFFVPGSLCPISHLYHYLHYALWGISYNLAQATLSVLCHKLDRGSIRSSPRYGLSTPCKLTKEWCWTVPPSSYLHNGPALDPSCTEFSTLDAGILIMVQPIRF